VHFKKSKEWRSIPWIDSWRNLESRTSEGEIEEGAIFEGEEICVEEEERM
jgi:hypothetical protein